MTSSTTLPRLAWQLATITETTQETSTARTLVLDVPSWPGHLAGQHVDVRLVGDDGRQAIRSFSIASPPEDRLVALTIERLPAAKVSSRLCEEVQPGFQFELRGPIGESFVWRASDGRPLQLVAGGSGIVPLMSMLRHRARVASSAGRPANQQPGARLLYSSQRWDGVIYRDELARLSAADPTFQVVHTITRDSPAGWTGFSRRIDEPMLVEVAWRPAERPLIYICGPTSFVESVAQAFVTLGHDTASIHSQRFGPTG